MVFREIKGDILIVDDDLPSVRLLSNLLAAHGFDVRGARDGSTALLMVAADPPDMVLLDIQMPDMDGYQVCEQLKANPATRDIPILFISAQESVEDKIKGFEVGGVDFISKPYQIEEILARVKTHLTISRLRVKVVNQLEELSALHRISKTIATNRELSQVLEIICKTVTDLFGAQLALIALQEKGSKELKGLFGYHRTSGAIALTAAMTLQSDLIPAEMANTEGKSINLTNLQNMPFPEQIHDYLRDHQIQSGLVTLLKYRGVCQGILIVAKGDGHSYFDQNQIDLVDKIATDISLAIENDFLNERARQAAVNAERQRLARELHDSVTQSIYSLTLLSNGWESMARQGTLDNPADAFQRLRAVGQQALREMRLLLHQLRPSILEQQGLIQAIQQRLDTVESRSSIEPSLVVRGDFTDLPPKLEDELFYIAQEALNNSLRHAMAESVAVRFEADQGKITLSVVDDGIGFSTSKKHAGMGLQNMQERANAIAGELSVQSETGHGTRVTISVDTNKGM